MTPTETAAILRQFNAWRRDFDDKIRQPDPREIGEAIDAAVEMIDRLELAESSVAWHRRRWMALQMHQTKMREPVERLAARLEAAEKSDAESIAMYRKARDERDALRAKIEAMERQKPVGKFAQHPSNGLWEQDGYGDNPEASPLYALPGAKAQNATSVPSEEDESVRKAWSRFSNELHRGPDAPYPGMSEAFEQHFSQSFTDRDWRAESGTWAAAWKAAKRHGAQPAQSVPNLDMDALERQNDEMKEEVGRLRDALALIADQYEPKCNLLIPSIARSALCATGAYGQTEAQPTPNVPDGWQLVPIEPTQEMLDATSWPNCAGTDYKKMLAAAPRPEAKP